MKKALKNAKFMLAVLLLMVATIIGFRTDSAQAGSIGDWHSPLPTMTQSAGFLANACGHPGYGGYLGDKYHIGADFDSTADADVYAIGAGKVLNHNADFGGTQFGRAIFIEHTAANGGKFVALYGHVNTGTVATNATVEAGQKIGTIYPHTLNGPHLHFGIHPGPGVPGSPWGIQPCSAWGNDGPATNGFVNPYPYLESHPRVNPDADGDGHNDGSDLCPNVYGYNPHGCPIIRNDFTEDGKSDIAAFYRHDNNVTNLILWNGGANTSVSGPYAPWVGNGWDGSRVIPAGTGHYKGEKQQSIAAFYRHDGGMLDLNVWTGNGNGTFSQYRAWHAPNSWEGDRIVPAGSGDYNKDGITDVAAFYRHDNYLVDFRVWFGQSSGYFTEPVGVWSGNGWDGSRIIPAGSGDVDGDGNVDVTTYYRHDNQMVDLNVWYGNGSGGFTLQRPWHAPNSWEGGRIIPAGVIDINRDGKDDMVAFYRHDNYYVNMRVWYGTGNRVMGEPGNPWNGNGWDGNRIIPAGTGDYNDDQKGDIATFYRHDNGMMDMNIWYGGGDGNMYLERPWHVDTAWEGDRLKPTRQ